MRNGTTTIKPFPIRVFYFKLMLFSLLPFFLLLASYSIWAIILRKKEEREKMVAKATSTLVILLFFVHPNIVSIVFNVFK